MTADGEESFGELLPHPRTEGEYGEKGTVQDFLLSQGVEPFIEAVERYVGLAGRMATKVQRSLDHKDDFRTEVQNRVEHIMQRQETTAPDWLDMDRVLARYCDSRGIAVPMDVAEKMKIHIQAVEEWVSGT